MWSLWHSTIEDFIVCTCQMEHNLETLICLSIAYE